MSPGAPWRARARSGGSRDAERPGELPAGVLERVRDVVADLARGRAEEDEADAPAVEAPADEQRVGRVGVALRAAALLAELRLRGLAALSWARPTSSRRSARRFCSAEETRPGVADRDAEQHADDERDEHRDQRDRVVAEVEHRRGISYSPSSSLQLQPQQVGDVAQARRDEHHGDERERGRRASTSSTGAAPGAGR